MGVFAKFGINFEEEFLGLRPSATTTLLTLPLPTACILETGLSIPTREALPAPAAECSAEATPSSDDDEGEDADATGSSVASTDARTTPAPSATGEPPKKREDSADKELTAVACASQLADCPDDLLTTITYKASQCAAPVKTGSCFAISDAEALEATSVVNTAPAAKVTENKIRADDPTGTGGTGTGTAGPQITAVEQEEELDEDACDEDTPEEGESTDEEDDDDESTDEVESGDAPAGSSEDASADVSEESSEDSPEDDSSEDTSADGSSAPTLTFTPPEPQPTGTPDSSSVATPGPETTGEPEPEDSPPVEDIPQTGSASRLEGSTLVLAAVGLAMWVLV